MAHADLGYQKDLFILAFDHRGSFQKKLFGVTGEPNAEETVEISSYKKIIYDGFRKAIDQGVDKTRAGILVDEQFGSEIINDARAQGFAVASPAEKSGQEEFDFEYGEEFGSHIYKNGASFCKVLVRYNPEGDAGMNQRQSERLKRLSEYCHENNVNFLFELLVPATKEQLEKAGGDKKKYDLDMRPDLMIRAIDELQKFGIEPDIWKLEGMDRGEDAKRVSDQCRVAGREKVGTVILGRGENDEKVRHWLATAAKVDGFIGFAVGRTIFWEPLKGVKEQRHSREQAVQMIADNYQGFFKIWEEARA